MEYLIKPIHFFLFKYTFFGEFREIYFHQITIEEKIKITTFYRRSRCTFEDGESAYLMYMSTFNDEIKNQNFFDFLPKMSAAQRVRQ